MSLKRNVSLAAALGYKGQAPMLTFILHRIGGVALFTFFTLYILALAGVSSVNAIFGNWFFQLFILFFGLFHAINGLRITILDLWPGLIVHYRRAIWVEWAVFIPLYALAFLIVVSNALRG